MSNKVCSYKKLVGPEQLRRTEELQNDTVPFRTRICIAAHPIDHTSQSSRVGTSLGPSYWKSRGHALRAYTESQCLLPGKGLFPKLAGSLWSPWVLCVLWDQRGHQWPNVSLLRISIEQPQSVCVGILSPMGTHLHPSLVLSHQHVHTGTHTAEYGPRAETAWWRRNSTEWAPAKHGFLLWLSYCFGLVKKSFVSFCFPCLYK